MTCVDAKECLQSRGWVKLAARRPGQQPRGIGRGSEWAWRACRRQVRVAGPGAQAIDLDGSHEYDSDGGSPPSPLKIRGLNCRGDSDLRDSAALVKALLVEGNEIPVKSK